MRREGRMFVVGEEGEARLQQRGMHVDSPQGEAEKGNSSVLFMVSVTHFRATKQRFLPDTISATGAYNSMSRLFQGAVTGGVRVGTSFNCHILRWF